MGLKEIENDTNCRTPIHGGYENMKAEINAKSKSLTSSFDHKSYDDEANGAGESRKAIDRKNPVCAPRLSIHLP